MGWRDFDLSAMDGREFIENSTSGFAELKGFLPRASMRKSTAGQPVFYRTTLSTRGTIHQRQACFILVDDGCEQGHEPRGRPGDHQSRATGNMGRGTGAEFHNRHCNAMGSRFSATRESAAVTISRSRSTERSRARTAFQSSAFRRATVGLTINPRRIDPAK